MLLDGFGRHIHYLRISITDRCNFRCVYCMPETGVRFRPKDEILTFEEVQRLAAIFRDHFGFNKFRITGGEPLVRSDAVDLTKMLCSLDGVDVHMTTNGYFLPEHAQALFAAGLRGLNISLDTLQPDRMFQISRRHYLPKVMAGVRAALDAGFEPLKINTVLIRGINNDEILDFAEWTRDTPVLVRFIEYMPYKDNQWEQSKVVHGDEVRRILAENYPHAPWFEEAETDGVSSLVRIPGHRGAVGFIDPMSNKFCHTCNRVRLTAEGQLRMCLFSDSGLDLRELVRDGSSDDEIARTIRDEIIGTKPAQNALPVANLVKVDRYMVEVGG